MKKVPCRLPDSELDIMLVLWHNKPPMSRLEIERIVNEKKNARPDDDPLSALPSGEKELRGSHKGRQKQPLRTTCLRTGLPAERKPQHARTTLW